ncbi:MAG: TadE/TadG family type IV pilus assembly protein, partial [Paracoccaceae bacterium]
GSTLVEFAIAMPLFLLILFGLIDFGRMGFEYVMANKAVQMAARVAVARLPACNGVVTVNARGTVPVGSVPPYFGTNCRAGATVCAAPATVTCTGNLSNATVAEIWGVVQKLMPVGAAPANLRFTYAYTPDLGFLGGPYVPMVTVQTTGLAFQFVTPLDALAAVAGSTGTTLPGTLPFPALSVTLPAEDLALGEAG